MPITNRRQAQEALVRFIEAKAAAEDAEENRRAIQADLIAYFDTVKDDSVSVKNGDGTVIKGSIVRSSVVNINEPRLKKALGQKDWAKVTKRVLDRGRLEERIASGDVDANVVAECSEEVPRSPYVRATVSKAKAKAGSAIRQAARKGA